MTFQNSSRRAVFIVSSLLFGTIGFNQSFGPNITGNTETTFQYLLTDTTIGAVQPSEKSVMNSYTNVNYSLKGFRAGVRFESYLPHTLGYPDRYSGSGIGYKYAGYSNKMIDVTVGNFYEQFGSGMIFRSYEARSIGIDNSLEGMKIIFRPVDGAEIKAIYGRPRYSFTDGKLINSEGIVRGIDGNIDLNTFYNLLAESKLKISMGASFLSKNQSAFHPLYIMPENVGSYGGRIDAKYGNFYLGAEHVIKEQDPSFDNNYIFNYGHASFITAGYSQKGLGIVLAAKSIDNMSYRANPDAILTDLNINFLPALTKAHTYNLAATLYPYATQPQGEVAYQADIFYKIPKKSKLGGKYGTSVNVNFALAFAPNRDISGMDTIQRVMYQTGVFDMSDSLFHRDFNIEVKRKINKKMKLGVKYFNFKFNNDVNNVTKEAYGYIESHIAVVDFTYKISAKHSIRTELQGLFTKQDRGNWSTVLIEYNISPKWFFAVVDQYNYGHPDESRRIHYLTGSAGFLFGSSRFIATYGKQNAGIFCIGGICRPVPASNGLTLTFTSSF
jgi:hypothetical protein